MTDNQSTGQETGVAVEVAATSDGFAEFLIKRASGSHTELTEALQRVVAAVIETRKPGSITYKLKLRPAKDMPGDAMLVTDSVETSVPQADRDAVGVMWPDADGNLLDYPSNQLGLQLGGGK
jgi:hypothetical protein